MDIQKTIKNYTYNQRHCLGEGSFGRVYQGRSFQGLKIAIKRFEKSMISKDPYLRTSLETEISIMKKLNHPNIVKFYDVVITDNSIYLIMQFCAGGDLKRYCRNRKLNEEQATNIIKQICKAFQQIVQLGIIHRDLKPANILVHQGVFKICDFGFAKFFTDISRMSRTCVGTPIYMSPQVLSQNNYTEKVDVWSLGILFYELLFGKLPYYGATEDALYKNIMRGPLIIPTCSNFTSNLLRGMLQIQQNKRYSWNKIFEIFNLDQIPEQKIEGGVEFQFYKPMNLKKESLNNQILNNYKETPNNYQNYEVHDENINNKNKQPLQRRPRNHLAFQNSQIPYQNYNTPVQNQNIPPEKGDQPIITEPKPVQLVKHKSSNNQSSSQNSRFLYFVLIELIVNPIKNSFTYPQLVSAIYRRAVDLYTKKIQKQKETNSLYARVLASQFEQLKSIQIQIPNFLNADMQKSAQSVYRQSTESGNKAPSLVWVKKIMNRNYTYQK